MKVFFLSAALISVATTPSFSCTTEELVTKAADVSRKIQEMMIKDAEKANTLLEKIAVAQGEAVKDAEGACKFYDEVLEELD